DLVEARIRHAERAEYDAPSFRVLPPALKERYFAPVGSRFKVKSWFGIPVHFRVLNLLDIGEAYTPGFFDAVFCRNVLIYFGDAMVYRICGLFHKLLAREGALFLGHSESLLGRTHLFRPQRASDFIYYVRLEP
ncbi:MAG TPA: CheR family methyltransferase, partial [Thermoanaerobaculia bacterium]|nr:CheR family methyltransferase [Thermoanaerobaculia bacterium]